MSLQTSDLELYKSNNSGSTGGTISATAITDAGAENLFDNVSGDEASTGLTDYRKFFFKNLDGSDSLFNGLAWLPTNTPSPDDLIYIGLGTSNDDDGSSSLTALSANSTITVVSDGADTRQVFLVGEDASGVRATETLTLTGTTPVVGAQTFSKLYLAYVTSTSASRITTVKQTGTGATLGTVGLNKYSAILYLIANSKDAGIKLGTIAAGASQGLWLKRVVSANASAYNDNSAIIKVEGETV